MHLQIHRDYEENVNFQGLQADKKEDDPIALFEKLRRLGDIQSGQCGTNIWFFEKRETNILSSCN